MALFPSLRRPDPGPCIYARPVEVGLADSVTYSVEIAAELNPYRQRRKHF